MKVAVIGANGLIGSRVVESFHLGGGPSVVAIPHHPARSVLAARFTVDIRAADAFDADSLARALQGCNAVVHAVRGEQSTLKRLASAVCRAAAQAGVRRLVYLSSSSVHGPSPAPGTNEQSRIQPASLGEDARAQLVAERQVLADCRRLSIAAYVLRPGIVYGPRSPLVAEIATLLRDERATLLDKGATILNSVYVDNLVAGIRGCLRAKEGAGQPYLIADAETVTWKDFYHAIARELDLPASRMRSVEAATFASHSDAPSPDEAAASLPHGLQSGLLSLQENGWKPSTQSAARIIGYAPVVTFSEAIRRSCAWWRFSQGDFFAAA